MFFVVSIVVETSHIVYDHITYVTLLSDEFFIVIVDYMPVVLVVAN